MTIVESNSHHKKTTAMVRTPTTPQRRASTAKQAAPTESSAAAALGSMSSYESIGDLFKKYSIKQIRMYKENIEYVSIN